MFDRIETLRMASSLTAHAAERQKLIAQNVANADTPGFRARDLVQSIAQAEIALETVVAIRDKVVEAYQEILRMPV